MANENEEKNVPDQFVLSAATHKGTEAGRMLPPTIPAKR